MLGEVRCGRIVHFRSPEPDKTHPKIPGYVNINATSGNKRWGGLSPMKLGPLNIIENLCPMTFYPSGVLPGFIKINDTQQQATAMNMENAWQYMKAMNIDVKDGIIQPSFFERRAKGYADPKPHRRPIPKAKGHPVAAFYNCQVLDYISSRPIYCNIYEQLVRTTPEYKELERMLNTGTNLLILGYDGRDIPITKESMRDAFLDPKYPFGHELCLVCLLKGFSPWRE